MIARADQGESWMRRAACHEASAELFFSDGRNAPLHVELLPCVSCAVRTDCLDFAVSARWAPQGVWGGLAEDDVKDLWRQRRARAKVAR